MSKIIAFAFCVCFSCCAVWSQTTPIREVLREVELNKLAMRAQLASEDKQRIERVAERTPESDAGDDPSQRKRQR